MKLSSASLFGSALLTSALLTCGCSKNGAPGGGDDPLRPPSIRGGQPEWVSIHPLDLGPDQRRTVGVGFGSPLAQDTKFEIKYFVTPEGGAAEEPDDGRVFHAQAGDPAKEQPTTPIEVTVKQGEPGFSFTVKTHSNLTTNYLARIEVTNTISAEQRSDTIKVLK